MILAVSGGLNLRGGLVAFELNPGLFTRVGPGVLTPACACAAVVSGFGVLIFAPETQAFSPAVTTHHSEDAFIPEIAPLQPTGLDPQPDPDTVVRLPVSSFHVEDATGIEVVELVPTGLNPQPDPGEVVRPKESGSERDRK